MKPPFFLQSASGRSPMIRVLLVIQVADASNQGRVPVRFRPIDRFLLSSESSELVIHMVFDDIIVNGRPFRASLGAGFHINVRHGYFSLVFLSQDCSGSAYVIHRRPRNAQPTRVYGEAPATKEFPIRLSDDGEITGWLECGPWQERTGRSAPNAAVKLTGCPALVSSSASLIISRRVRITGAETQLQIDRFWKAESRGDQVVLKRGFWGHRPRLGIRFKSRYSCHSSLQIV